MPKHYIVGGGLLGCLYSHCASFSTKTECYDYIASIYDLSPNYVARKMRQTGFRMDWFDGIHGNDYVEITECYCDDPDCHNDDSMV